MRNTMANKGQKRAKKATMPIAKRPRREVCDQQRLVAEDTQPARNDSGARTAVVVRETVLIPLFSEDDVSECAPSRTR